jgi:hypothetical protein
MSADNMVRQVANVADPSSGTFTACHLAWRHAFSIHDESVARILRAGELWELLFPTEFQKRHANRRLFLSERPRPGA